MAIHYNLSSIRQRRELRNLEHSIAAEPFSKNLQFKFKFDDLDISTIKFISDYLGYEASDIHEHFQLHFFKALKMTEFLENRKYLNIKNPNYFWNYGLQCKHAFSSKVLIDNPSFFNYMINKYSNRGFEANTIGRLAFNTYTEVFLDTFNDENFTPVEFVDKKTARYNAMKNKKFGLIKALNFYRDNSSQVKLGFLGLEDLTKPWSIRFYQRE